MAPFFYRSGHRRKQHPALFVQHLHQSGLRLFDCDIAAVDRDGCDQRVPVLARHPRDHKLIKAPELNLPKLIGVQGNLAVGCPGQGSTGVDTA